MSIHATGFSPKPAAVALGVTAAIALAAFGGVVPAMAADPGDDDFLGVAETFVIVATTTVTDAGAASDVYGNVALTSVAPGAMELQEDQDVINGQVINGDIYVDSPTPDLVAQQAVAAVGIAYVGLAAADEDEVVGAVNLALIVGHQVGLESVYLPGVYESGSMILLDGTIVLDGGNNLDSVFIFQAGSGLTIASGASVVLRNGAQACNVYWKVLSDAEIDTGAQFAGTVVAGRDIWVRTGAVVDGQLLAGALGGGEVTLDHNVIDGQTLCIRSSTTGGVTTTTTRVDGTTTTVVVPTLVVPPATTPPTTLASTGTGTFRRPTTLANTGSTVDATLPLSGALVVFVLGGIMLVGSRRRAAKLEQSS
jgi:hypothetical protein